MPSTGGQPVTAPGWTGEPNTDIAVIDCDVHHSLKSQDDLLSYLPLVYREQATDQGFLLPGTGYYNVPFSANRPDLSDGKETEQYDVRELGSDYDILRDEHLDRWNIDYALANRSSQFL